MVQAWYMDSSEEDQRREHKLDPPEYVDLQGLFTLGVLYWKIDADNYEAEGRLKQIKQDRGYTYDDVLNISPNTLENYDEKIKTFFIEHIHRDEEIRLVLDGSGYFDVRDDNDRWIRISASKGDLLVIPSGIYHRFTLDSNNYIKAMRLFVGEPTWIAINRPLADREIARILYIRKQHQGFQDYEKPPASREV